MEGEAIYTLWLREMKHFFRAKGRVFGSLATPFFWLAFVGIGLSSSLYPKYLDFISPGIIAMTLLFTSTFSGVSVIWDKQFGFMKEILVAPVSRNTVVLGKMLGGVSIALLQGLCVLFLSTVLGVKIWWKGIPLAIIAMFLISASFVCFGLIFAAKMEDPHGFQVVLNFIVMPMFFLSGALFPINRIPTWLKILTRLNPFTYAVDSLRACLLRNSIFLLEIDFLVLSTFFLICFAIATYLFSRMEA